MLTLRHVTLRYVRVENTHKSQVRRPSNSATTPPVMVSEVFLNERANETVKQLTELICQRRGP